MARGKPASRAYQGRSWRTNPGLATVYNHRVALVLGCAFLWALYLWSGGTKEANSQDQSRLLAAALAGRLSEETLGQHSPDSLRTALQRAIGVVDTRKSGQSSEHNAESTYLLAQIQGILHDLTEGPAAVDCYLDPHLFTDKFPVNQDHKVLLAANMHNNEELLPHFITQLVHVLSLLPYGSAFLSVYESGSTDGTGAWLEVLRRLVTAMHIPHRIITGGNLTRGPDQDRIDFLAQARNRALEPLWLNASAATTSDFLPPSPPPPAKADRKRALSWFMASDSSAAPLWHAEKIVFLNDVFFCARDVIRLLHHEDADMACGMDFDRTRLEDTPWKEQRRRFGIYLQRKYGLPQFLGRLLGVRKQLMMTWRHGVGNDEYQKGGQLKFYDTWVARDIDGNLLTKTPPYATDPYSLERTAQGLPFPAKCCWNGVVAMTAAPFSQHNLRMRMHKAGECAASECTLVCNDFLRLGYSNFVIDPGVRQAYLARDARDLYNETLVPELPVTSWDDVARAPPIDRSLTPMRPYVQCCGLPEGHNMIEFDKDCHWDNFMTPNYTRSDMPLHVPASQLEANSSVNATDPWQGIAVKEPGPKVHSQNRARFRRVV